MFTDKQKQDESRDEALVYLGLIATPDAVVKTLHEATLEALQSAAVRERIESQAGRVKPGSPAELDALVAADIRQYTKIVRERNIKPE